MGLLSRIALVLVGLLFVMVACFCGWLFAYSRRLPDINQLSQFAPNAESEISDPCLAGPSVVLPLNMIGTPFREALLVAEPVQTLPDQIARTLLCNSGDRAGRYALNTVLLSWKISIHFSEEQIFTIYANRAYFGSEATGIQNASIKFFRKRPNTLSTEEAAFLAGLLRAPQYLTPFEHPERAVQRRNKVLEAMVAGGKLSPAEAAKAEAVPYVPPTDTQGPTEPQKTAKEVVEQFCKMETEGGRLDPEGWQDARRFFVRPSPFAPGATIFVIGKTYTVWDPMALPNGTTEVTVEIDPVGQIDSKLRFAPPVYRYYKNARHFKLVFSDKRWELGTKGDTSKEVTESAPRWLIDEPSGALMLTVTTAIRYVSKQRDSTPDPVVRKNADETIAKLKRLP